MLTPKDGRYTAVSELSTAFPTHGGPCAPTCSGNGEGDRQGDTLSGTAHTQLVMQTVPGVDTNFAFIPRRVGPRLVSTWKAHLEPDGTLRRRTHQPGRERRDLPADQDHAARETRADAAGQSQAR